MKKQKKLKQLKDSLLVLIFTGLFFLNPFFSFQMLHAEEDTPKDKVIKKIDGLIDQKDFEGAESLCSTYVSKSKPQYYLYIGDFYLKNNSVEKALKYFQGLSPKKQEEYGAIYERLIQCFELKNDWENALKYTEMLTMSPFKFLVFEKWARICLDKGDEIAAKIYYTRAISTYENLIQDILVEWKNEYCASLKRCVNGLKRLSKSTEEKEQQDIMAKILVESGQYIDKMKKSSIYFFCEEDIMETFDSYPPRGKQTFTKSHLIYEYQLVQNGDKLEETRKLLGKNGNRQNLPDTTSNLNLATSSCRYEKLIFGPFDLLHRGNQPDYYYKILKEDILWDEPVWVMEALPLASMDQPSGVLYIGKKDYSVLKLEWSPRTIRSINLIRERSRSFGAKPVITFYLEFKVKKNGVRFPSRYYLRESYDVSYTYDKLILDVKFRNFSFFIVGTEVTSEKADSGE